MSKSIDPAYLEIQITVRNMDTGRAQETTYFCTQDVSLITDEAYIVNNLWVRKHSFEFTPLPDETRDNATSILKDLSVVPPCRCYENLMKG